MLKPALSSLLASVMLVNSAGLSAAHAHCSRPIEGALAGLIVSGASIAGGLPLVVEAGSSLGDPCSETWLGDWCDAGHGIALGWGALLLLSGVVGAVASGVYLGDSCSAEDQTLGPLNLTALENGGPVFTRITRQMAANLRIPADQINETILDWEQDLPTLNRWARIYAGDNRDEIVNLETLDQNSRHRFLTRLGYNVRDLGDQLTPGSRRVMERLSQRLVETHLSGGTLRQSLLTLPVNRDAQVGFTGSGVSIHF